MRDTWGPPATGWPTFCKRCGKKQAPDALHTCPVPDVAGRDVARCDCPGIRDHGHRIGCLSRVSAEWVTPPDA